MLSDKNYTNIINSLHLYLTKINPIKLIPNNKKKMFKTKRNQNRKSKLIRGVESETTLNILALKFDNKELKIINLSQESEIV